MDLTESQREHLTRISQDILAALKLVAQRAAEGLAQGATVDARVALANPENTMTGGGNAAKGITAAQGEVRDGLRRILSTPFNARVVVRWENAEEETYYVTKGAASALSGGIPGIKLASYVSPLGRLAEFPAGESGVLRERAFEVLERTLLRPVKDEEWDAAAEPLEVDEWRAVLESLRRFLDLPGASAIDEHLDILSMIRAAADSAGIVRAAVRRQVVERMSLRDQPTLDRWQGEIFRLPLQRQLLLLGPPGSGKTTTLIQRLAAKRNTDGLLEDEQEILTQTQLRPLLRDEDTWVMYSPTELLKLYLREAFNREQVPASEGNLRTWEKERRDLARNVFGLIKVNSDSPGFEFDASARNLIDESSPGLSALFDSFAEFANNVITDRVSQAFDALASSPDGEAKSAAATARTTISASAVLEAKDVPKLLDSGDSLRIVLSRLRKETGEQLDRIVRRLLRPGTTLLSELVQAAAELRGTVREDDDEDDDDDMGDANAARQRTPESTALDILLAALRTRARLLARGRRQLSGRAARVFALLGDRSPEDSELLEVGGQLATSTELRALVNAPRRSVMGLPALYRRFRTANGAFFVEGFDRAKISENECDVLLLVALQAGNRAFGQNRRRLVDPGLPGWLQSLRARFTVQVFVDEATDFSAVQLACTLLLTHPGLRSWFACGDFRQRITPHGVQTQEELRWTARIAGVKAIDTPTVSIGYRQSLRLRALTSAFDDVADCEPSEGASSREDDIYPILAEHLFDKKLGEWLAHRIGEIESTLSGLPSIAIFVDGDDQVDSLVSLLRPELAALSIAVVACKGGLVVGDQQEVRVFDVRHIKGLEFEAVFFVGVDRLHARIPDLFDKYLYVGLTRAATYLGVTCDGKLPTPLERLRSHFASSWAP